MDQFDENIEFTVVMAIQEHIEAFVNFSYNLNIEITKAKSICDSHLAGIMNVLEGSIDEYGLCPTCTYLIAFSSEVQAAGTLLILQELNPHLGGIVFCMCKVYVDSKYRRKGVLTELYLSSMQEVRKNPYFKAFRLTVMRNNEIAQKTYEKFGFDNSGEEFADCYMNC